ncbi:hypothetical protein Tsubulata_028158 [Turnera subulata]|uniref:Uncharacterized protein n=1 Tax=Turnera subulata TaxID=218843 RepID=A0A9Q0FRY2_9ROSI|nr:hypothetical protein Tsubulata_028158 [Turnera subulata]
MSGSFAVTTTASPTKSSSSSASPILPPRRRLERQGEEPERAQAEHPLGVEDAVPKGNSPVGNFCRTACVHCRRELGYTKRSRKKRQVGVDQSAQPTEKVMEDACGPLLNELLSQTEAQKLIIRDVGNL